MSLPLSKYPVFSVTGNEYGVDILESDIFDDVVRVSVYEPYSNWRGKRKFKKVSQSSYDLSVWGHDYIGIAKHEVSDYEKENADRIAEELLRKKGERQFEMWDGDCGV